MDVYVLVFYSGTGCKRCEKSLLLWRRRVSKD
jgi:hypothetical protein